MSTTIFDALVIGSGQAGNPLAIALAKAGKKTAVVESTHIGGTCVNDGCSPTKTLIASGRAAYFVRRAADYGVNIGKDVCIDMVKVRQRKRDLVESFRSGNENRLKAAGVEIFLGTGSFINSTELKVKLNSGGETLLTASQFFINTGERAKDPQILGLKDVRAKLPDRILDSTSIQELDVVPTSLIVVGGGYIGLEFGQLFHRLGAEVTVIQRNVRLLPREDPEITDVLQAILREDGLKIHVSTETVDISATDTGDINLLVRARDGIEQVIHGSHVLLAAGRTPNTDNLHASQAGITVNHRGHIETNERLETSVPNIYALGDVRGPPAFTHISYDDFRILRDQLGLADRPGAVQSRTVHNRDGIVPYVVYTDPQLGHVGLHLNEIPQEKRKNIKVASMPMSWVARALETDEQRGLMKAIVNSETGDILGFSCLGIEGGELMSTIQVAMMGGLKYWQLQDAVFAHPTIAESLNNLWGTLKDA